MILNPSSFFGRRSSSIVTLSSERLFASSMAYLATFERFPASSRSGLSVPVIELMRAESLSRLVSASFIRTFLRCRNGSFGMGVYYNCRNWLFQKREAVGSSSMRKRKCMVVPMLADNIDL